MTKRSLLLLSIAALVGCGTDSADSADIATTPLAGMVGGQAWTFQAGHTDAFLSDGKPEYFATLYAEQFTPCGFSPTGPHLIVSIPKTPGDYELGPMLNMTFVSDNENKISFDGRIVVDSATPTTVSGGLVASFDGDNEVNGTFEVTVCPGQ